MIRQNAEKRQAASKKWSLFPNAIKASGAAHANLIWHISPEFLVSAEYMIGKRKNADGADGRAQRVQFSAMYSF
jgi:hypothetical protein